MDAVEFSTNRLSSPFAVAQFMADTTQWDATVKKIQALKPVGIHSLQVAGRFDIAAYQLYDEPLLDWVLIVFNGFKHVGDFGTLQIKQTIPLVLTSGQVLTIDEPLTAINTVLHVADLLVTLFPGTGGAVGKYVASVGGIIPNDLQITFSDTGASVENIGLGTISFTLVFSQASEDTSLDSGTAVVYPDKNDIKNALKIVTEEKNKTVEGFARL